MAGIRTPPAPDGFDRGMVDVRSASRRNRSRDQGGDPACPCAAFARQMGRCGRGTARQRGVRRGPLAQWFHQVTRRRQGNDVGLC